MTQHLIQHIFPFDKQQKAKIDRLLQRQHIRRDPHLDYTCAIIDEQGEPIATGSLYGNSLRCLAVDQAYQGQGLLNHIVSHLIEEAYSRGHHHLFIYTKIAAAPLLLSLGFHVIAMVDDTLCFLENKKRGFEHYLSQLEKPQISPQKTAAIVLNANPFTLGHLHLIEKACADNELVHLFMVSQDSSLIPYYIRKELIIKGTAHLANIIYHDSGPYMISQATFPAYFQKDELAVIDSQAKLDIVIFRHIAEKLQIKRRYVGEEPTSMVTQHYNTVMLKQLPCYGIDVQVIPRKTFAEGKIISASLARQAIKDDDQALLELLLPKTSLDFFRSEAAQPTITKIKAATDLKHY